MTVSTNTKVKLEELTYMTTREAAEYLRVTEHALRMKVYRGQLNAKRLGRMLRFKRSELDRLINQS